MTHASPNRLPREVLSCALHDLRRRQCDDGHWIFELEADVTITAEYVLLEHFTGRITLQRQLAMAQHLRRKQTAVGGGWPLFEDGAFDLSASVKAYFALKLSGDPVDAPHMVRARQAILAAGGITGVNVFTRIQLALFDILPWRVVPAMPVELMFLPKTAPFSIWSVSYWSRACIVPLLVIQTLRPKAENPRRFGLDELFVEPSEHEHSGAGKAAQGRHGRLFAWLDRLLKLADPLHSRRLRKKAVAMAVAYVEERLNGSDGLGAIYPAMAYSLMMYYALGRRADDPRIGMIWDGLDRLVVETPDEAYCQPCRSPVWDTALAGHALIEAIDAGVEGGNRRDLESACDWLAARQITTVKGDWSATAPRDLEPGGWAFQYRNDHFPDVDDTSVVAMLLLRTGLPRYGPAIERARNWILGMQSRNGGWGAFDVDNDKVVLNDIPFADHGALLDPPTADVTARCVSFLARLGHADDRAAIDRALAFLLREQKADGSWFGRWGTNYIYGTWSVLSALNDAGLRSHPVVAAAARWLSSVQHADGGWGEDERSYEADAYVAGTSPQPSQTAWAMLGLMAAGEAESLAVRKGAQWLESAYRAHGWQESHNAVGFPRVFYLLYKGYSLYFPVLALARYRRLSSMQHQADSPVLPAFSTSAFGPHLAKVGGERQRLQPSLQNVQRFARWLFPAGQESRMNASFSCVSRTTSQTQSNKSKAI